MFISLAHLSVTSDVVEFEDGVHEIWMHDAIPFDYFATAIEALVAGDELAADMHEQHLARCEAYYDVSEYDYEF